LISFRVTKGCIYATEQVGNSRVANQRPLIASGSTYKKGRAEVEEKNPSPKLCFN